MEHIPGIINPRDMFTKDMEYNTHFRNLRDSIMVSLQAFLKYSHNVPSHIIYSQKLLPYYPILSEHIVTDSTKLLSREMEGRTFYTVCLIPD